MNQIIFIDDKNDVGESNTIFYKRNKKRLKQKTKEEGKMWKISYI